MTPDSASRNLCVLLPLLLVFLAAPLMALSESDGSSSKLTVHGFATQAYAWTDGTQLLGITEDGTTDYRDLALQFRYRMTERDEFVIQLSHERKGKSPVQPFRADVEVGWAYYERDLSETSTLKIGRAPLPIGLFNEIRNVGTLLPFFSPPFSVYQEGSFTSETVDGLIYTKSFRPGTAWSLDLELYYGGWNLVESYSGIGTAQARADDAAGLHLWLETPVDGLSFGAGMNRYDLSGGVVRLDDSDTWKGYYLSAELDRERFVVRGEYYLRDMRIKILGFPFPDVASEASYVQVGIRLNDHLSVYGQLDWIDIDLNAPYVPDDIFVAWKDQAVSLTYGFSSNVVLKLEVHENESYLTDDATGNFLLEEPPKTRYGILSLSTSF